MIVTIARAFNFVPYIFYSNEKLISSSTRVITKFISMVHNACCHYLITSVSSWTRSTSRFVTGHALTPIHVREFN